MNHEEIIAMALEASSMARLPWNGEWIFRSKKELMAFAALVAEKAAAKEREAWRASLEPAFRGRMGSEQVREIVQSAIRARGQKEGV